MKRTSGKTQPTTTMAVQRQEHLLLFAGGDHQHRIDGAEVAPSLSISLLGNVLSPTVLLEETAAGTAIPWFVVNNGRRGPIPRHTVYRKNSKIPQKD